MQPVNHTTMLHKHNILLICILTTMVLLFVGAGCSADDQASTKEATPTTSEKVVVKKPAGTDSIDYAIESCESHGYEAVLKYNKDTKSTDTFCEFGNGYACNALAYLMGACNTTSSNRIYIATEDGEPDNLRTCSEKEEPVCSKDGITYVNSCIAALQSAEISHIGVCTEEDIRLATKNTSSKNNTNTSSGSSGHNTSVEKNQSPPTGTPSWTTYLVSIAGNKATGTEAPIIQACTYGSVRVFYMVENCPNCFSTLYSNEGTVLCHPHNNLRGECPDYFDINSAAKNCRGI